MAHCLKEDLKDVDEVSARHASIVSGKIKKEKTK